MLSTETYEDYQQRYNEIMEMLEDCCLSDHENSTRTEMLIEKSEEKPDEKPDIKKAKKVRKKRGQYQKASSEQIWTLVYLYYRRHLTIKEKSFFF